VFKRFFKGKGSDSPRPTYLENQEPNIPWLVSLKLNRFLTIIVVVQSFVIVGMATSYVFLFPLKEKIPIIVEFSNGTNNFAIVQKGNEEIRSNANLIEMLLTRYVTDRETVDKITEEPIRYPRVMAMSSPTLGADFRRTYGDKTMGLYFKEGFKRSIRVTRSSSLAPGVFQLEFVATDTLDGRGGENKSEWVATMDYGFSDQLVKYDERLLNPVGMFISEYTLSRRSK
jgi:type IV secretion system protein VirB8